MKAMTRIISVFTTLVAAFAILAANAFAATPCSGIYYETEVPDELKT